MKELDSAKAIKELNVNYAPLNHSHNYIPLSGGTISGNITKTGTGAGFAISNGTSRTMMYASVTPGEHIFGGSNNSTLEVTDYIRVGSNLLRYTTNGKNYNIYHEGNKPSASSIGAAEENRGVHKWNAVLSANTWSRILYVGATSLGSGGIIGITGTRNSVVYSNTFIFNAAHPGRGNITQISGGKYSQLNLRLVVNSNGDCYVEALDTANQGISVSFLQLSGSDSITKYTSATSGATLPSGFQVAAQATMYNNGINAESIKVNGAEVYHPGNKPTPADIGAASSSHNHDGVYMQQATIATSSFWGMTANGNQKDWVRTTANGIIPYINGGASSLGTSSWPFNDIYANNIYDNGVLLENKFSAATHTHSVLTGINDTRSTTYTPSSSRTDFKVTFQNNNTNGVNDGGSFYSLMHIPRWTDSSGGYGSQLIFTDNENIWYRRGISDTNWGSWRRLWHSGNLNPDAYFLKSGGNISGNLTVNNGKTPAFATNVNNSEIYTYKLSVTGDYTAWANQNAWSGVIIDQNGVSTSGEVRANIIRATSNGQGNNFAIGDDCWLGDINEYATVKLQCQDGSGTGHIRFGNGAKLGYGGGAPLDLHGSLWVTENIFTNSGVSLGVSYSDRCDDSPWYGIGRAAIGLNTSERCVQLAGYFGVRMRADAAFIDLYHNSYNNAVRGHWLPYDSRTYWLGANSPDRQWKGVCCEGGVVGASDIRSKENVERLNGNIVSYDSISNQMIELNAVDQRAVSRALEDDYYEFMKDRFKPTYYNYKLSNLIIEETGEYSINPEDEYKMLKNVGFIAQDYDLENDKVAQEFIFENPDGTLAYNHMSYVTVGMIALQETIKKLEEALNKIDELNKRIDMMN